MKKIIITILIGLFSCQTPVVNNDKDKNMTTTTKIEPKDNTKPDFSGKDCIPYDLPAPELQKFTVGFDPEIQKYMEKSSSKKENPYLGKIEITINQGVLPYNIDDVIIINQENKLKIDEIEKFSQEGAIGGIRINDKDIFYLDEANFLVIFNNTCQYEFFKSQTNILNLDTSMSISKGYTYFSFRMDLSKEKIEIEKIEPLLHKYNKVFINNITKIEFASINDLKIFLLFIKLSIQEPVFYKDLKIPIHTIITVPT